MRFFFFLFSFFLLMPFLTQAAELGVVTEQTPPRIGQEVPIRVDINTLDTANALEGTLTYDPDVLTLARITDKDSVITFWITRPQEQEVGKVTFSGITPGGFIGAQLPVITAFFVPKKVSTTTLALEEVRVLQHDGKGTPLPTTTRSLILPAGVSNGTLPYTASDTEPPEYFTPEIITHSTIGDGVHVLIFDTADTQSGPVTYYIKESRVSWLAPFMRFKVAESPYVLLDQNRYSTITIKAVDQANNERIIVLPPTYQGYADVYSVIAILAIVLFFWFIRRKWHQRHTS
jgi:hypothetical protein